MRSFKHIFWLGFFICSALSHAMVVDEDLPSNNPGLRAKFYADLWLDDQPLSEEEKTLRQSMGKLADKKATTYEEMMELTSSPIFQQWLTHYPAATLLNNKQQLVFDTQVKFVIMFGVHCWGYKVYEQIERSQQQVSQINEITLDIENLSADQAEVKKLIKATSDFQSHKLAITFASICRDMDQVIDLWSQAYSFIKELTPTP